MPEVVSFSLIGRPLYSSWCQDSSSSTCWHAAYPTSQSSSNSRCHAQISPSPWALPGIRDRTREERGECVPRKGDTRRVAQAAPHPDEGKQLLLKGGRSDKERDLNSYNVAVYNMNTFDICLKSSVLNEWTSSKDGAYKALSLHEYCRLQRYVLIIYSLCL